METQDAQESTSSQPGGTSPAANHSGTQSPTATSITAFPSYGSDSRGGFSRNESAPQIHNPRLPPSSRPVPTVSRNDHTASRSSQDHVDVHERHPAPFSVATGRSSREVADIHTRPLTHRPPAQPPMNRYTTAQPVFDQGQAAYQSRRPIDQIDSGYDAFTPRGAWVQREPTWSLATTLPRVVRPGMRKTSSRTVSSQRSSNDVEASPQLAQTPGVRKSTTSRQREDRLAPQVGETPGVRRSSTQRTSTRRESEEQHRKDAELYQQGIGQGDMAPDATVEGNEDNLAGLMPLPTEYAASRNIFIMLTRYLQCDARPVRAGHDPGEKRRRRGIFYILANG